jgi:isopenicillin-N N-acyltransferase-like protein
VLGSASGSIPLIKVRGHPYRRGLEHGRACGDLIRRYPDVLLEVARIEASWRALKVDRLPSREDLMVRALRFLPALNAFAPHLVEEIRGIADGARLPFAEVLLVNVRSEVMGIGETESLCTSFALGRSATANGTVLAGQNLDQNPLNRDLLVVLHVEPERGPSIVMCSFAGLVGYPGINSAGVSFFQNALSTSSWRAAGMPHYLLKRVLLEQVDVPGCLAVASAAQVCSSTNYVLTDGGGRLVDAELTPEGMELVEADDDIVVHANHFVSPGLAARDALKGSMPDSPDRHSRLLGLLRDRRGHIQVRDLQTALADHTNGPASVCRHQPDVQTIASIIAEPEQGRLHVSRGQPCSGSFTTYEL